LNNEIQGRGGLPYGCDREDGGWDGNNDSVVGLDWQTARQ